jgi:hypothetical protein
MICVKQLRKTKTTWTQKLALGQNLNQVPSQFHTMYVTQSIALQIAPQNKLEIIIICGSCILQAAFRHSHFPFTVSDLYFITSDNNQSVLQETLYQMHLTQGLTFHTNNGTISENIWC